MQLIKMERSFIFSCKRYNDIFRIGVAISNSPSGPFIAEDNYIEGTYSIDPAVYESKDEPLSLLGWDLGIGQLQNWRTGKFIAEDTYPQTINLLTYQGSKTFRGYEINN